MPTSLFQKFAPVIASMSAVELEREMRDPVRILLQSACHRGKRVDIAYAPFDYINAEAKIVIVGLTPGRQQMQNALSEFHRLLRSGNSASEIASLAKVYASFSGPMRKNLVDMLDDIGIAKLLQIPTTATLWNDCTELVHFTSALRYPVFVDGANYSGSPSLLNVPILRQQLTTHLADEMAMLKDCLFIPLGPKVCQALEFTAGLAGLSRSSILSGLPHPSGANAERIAYFMGAKQRDQLSVKTDPDKLDRAREGIIKKVTSFQR